MEKYEQGRNRQGERRPAVPANKMLIWLIIALVAVLIVLILVAVTSNNDANPDASDFTNPEQTDSQPAVPDSAMKELTVDSVEDVGDMIHVTTSYGVVKYPYAFADLVSVSAVNLQGKAALEFTGNIEGEQYPLYTIWFNSETEIRLGTLRIMDGYAPVPVCAQLYPVPEELPESFRISFNAGQETFNDVVSSLMELDNFESAD